MLGDRAVGLFSLPDSTALAGGKIYRRRFWRQSPSRMGVRGVFALWPILVAAALLSGVVGVAVSESLTEMHSAPSPSVHHRFVQRGGLPMALASAVSASFGTESTAYRVHSVSSHGFQAQNAAQGLHVGFGSGGVQVRSGDMHVGLSMRAVGFGTSLHAVASVRPVVTANRVTYARAGLSEWYRNGPLGLEQGFTIHQAPAGHVTGPLTLSVALSGNAQDSLVAGGRGLTLRHGGSSLHYGGLVATDAHGRTLHSHLALRSGQLLLMVDARGARYPLRIDPLIQQGEKLTGSGEVGAGLFGYSVALSADGNTALIGSPNDHDNVGAAWVFTRSGTVWTQQGEKLTGSGEVGAGLFGYSVALSADGNTALIGGLDDNTGLGGAWVFTRSGTTWTPQDPKLTGKGESGSALFGYSVALSADGNTALIGGPDDNNEGVPGAVWVFTRSGTTWTQQGEKLTGSGASVAAFGISTALSSDGDTALVGGPSQNGRIGAVWVFTRSGTTWTQQGEKLTGSGESGAGWFGYRVALSSDGNTALIGGPYDNNYKGAVWVFTRSGTVWTQQGEKLTGSDGVGEVDFGYGVALSSDGNSALIGGPSDNNYKGAVWAFTRSGTVWTQQGDKLTGSGATGAAWFGWKVALSSEGNTALIGGPWDRSNTGAVWIFAAPVSPSPPTVVTGTASSIVQASATLDATVNPNGREVSECEFEYGPSVSYGASVSCSTAPGSGESPVSVSAELTGLASGTTYHYRIVATNGGGTSYGADARLTTLGPPDFGRCVKVVGEQQGKKTVYHGHFTGATCLVTSPTKAGRYEWYPGVVNSHLSITTSLATLETVAKAKVTCASGSGAGAYLGTEELTDVNLKFAGCESGGRQCTTLGLAAGDLETKQLEGVLGWEDRAKKKAALDLHPEGTEATFLEYRCEGDISTTLTGSVLVPLSSSKMAITRTLKYKASKGKQKPEAFEGQPTDVLTASLNADTFVQTGLTMAATLTSEEPVEINPAA